MQGKKSLILGVAVLILGFVAYLSVFTVHQTQQAVVLQFGELKRVVDEPGLGVKLPWQDIRFQEKRVLNLDPRAETIVLADQRRVTVDAFIRYRIVNPEQFIRVAITEANLQLKLEPIVNNKLRAVLGQVLLTTILSEDRTRLMQQIREQVNVEVRRPASNFGIDVLDVRIIRADLLPEVSQNVYARMEAERKRDAAEFRALGQEQFLRITATADREATVIRAEAQRQAEILRGEGDAERTRILNEAYGQDPGFFEFYRSMQAYEASIGPDNSMLVIPPTNEFFNYFNNPAGQPGNQ
ncbi:MAG: protease modulator HflC [Kiloniellales bacterium]|nr:protease modulator HflC [Kiloniellales bacterium]MDJ0970148.1 protease modulator HflC [Kiloniellales bacterium]MDJ0982782.1 protease modulator HflC [Kiloniellales bacterium]